MLNINKARKVKADMMYSIINISESSIDTHLTNDIWIRLRERLWKTLFTGEKDTLC